MSRQIWIKSESNCTKVETYCIIAVNQFCEKCLQKNFLIFIFVPCFKFDIQYECSFINLGDGRGLD